MRGGVTGEQVLFFGEPEIGHPADVGILLGAAHLSKSEAGEQALPEDQLRNREEPVQIQQGGQGDQRLLQGPSQTGDLQHDR